MQTVSMPPGDAEALVQAALPVFGLAEDSTITFVKYRENHVFRVDTPTGDAYAVKLHRPGYHDDAEILTELRYVQQLSSRDLPVPQIRPTTDGELFGAVTDGNHTRNVSMVHWLHSAVPSGDVGEAFTGSDSNTAEDFAQIGDLLGRLHTACMDIGMPEDFRRGAWDAPGLAGPTPLWGDPRNLPSLSTGERELLRRSLDRLHSQLTELGTAEEIFGVVHGDATPENVLRTPNGPGPGRLR